MGSKLKKAKEHMFLKGVDFMEKRKILPEELLQDRLDGIYLENERENLFGDFEDEAEMPDDFQQYEPETVEDMCRQIGVDADILRAVVAENIMPQVIENARLITARRAAQQFKDGSWEKKRFYDLENAGFGFAEAVEKVKHEQLLKRIKMLEKQLENRQRTAGSAYSEAKMEFDD